ncbi:hypothetical protein GCM10007276_26960 [Agaricicola taiwanensis]|uniref:Tripartite tricarboxylate transporter substrate binding protein n=1 Tax=Agaricicola taiwanensis TaxID=591372 RepID=A0A8J2YKG2_9RHOB|nr:tripartite tricarboxylate transporter substrate binding protein [Agaricicola taiwanensis]GGE48414.1 hypothetical protein GCM10007276_26960 [Agaricicola taiwanensis]
MMIANSVKRIAATIVAAAALMGSAAAQDYPTEPVTIVVPFAPGGRVDGIARVLAESLSKQLGQPFVVSNREGAGGSVGADYVAKAKPDGYTLLLNSAGTHAILPNVDKNLAYDSVKDFTPIANLVEGFTFIGAHTSVKADNIKELIDLAKENPGKIGFATSGVGTYGHFAGESFKIASDINLLHVPYRGSGPAMNDLAAGHVPLMIAGEIVELAKAGKIKILAVTNEQRWHELPDVPTLKESGFPQFTLHSWIGLVGPAGLPAGVVEKLSKATETAMADPAVQDRLKGLGVVVNFSSPEAFAKRISEDRAAYGEIVKKAGLTFK